MQNSGSKGISAVAIEGDPNPNLALIPGLQIKEIIRYLNNHDEEELS